MWISAPKCNAPANPLAHLKMRFAIDAQDALDIDDHAIPPEQNCKSSEAEASTLGC